MKYRSKQQKPDTGMEMTVTLSMPADRTVDQCTDAIIQFMEGVTRLSNETGTAWIKILCTGIPEELEARLATALEPARPRPELVVDNTPQP